MSEDKNFHESVIGIYYNSAGLLCQRVRTADGKIKELVIPGSLNVKNEPESAKEFIETEFDDDILPHDLVPSKTSPLINKAVANELSNLTKSFKTNSEPNDVIQQTLAHLMDVIFAEHALLIRMIGSPESLAERTQPLEIRNSALYESIMLQIDILKDPWLDVKHKIKLIV